MHFTCKAYFGSSLDVDNISLTHLIIFVVSGGVIRWLIEVRKLIEWIGI